MDERKIADSLDPAQYASHVTRTAILLEQLARDVSALRDETERGVQNTNGMRSSISAMDRDLALLRESLTAKIVTNETNIHNLEERLRWLGRLVIGTLVTGIVGGAIAIVFKLFEATK